MKVISLSMCSFDRSVSSNMSSDNLSGSNTGAGAGASASAGSGIRLVAKDAFLEVRDHEGETLSEGDLGLPPEQFLGTGDIGLALVGVILRVGAEFNLRIGIDGFLHHICQFEHGELAGVAQVEGADVLSFHQPHQTLHLLDVTQFNFV